MLRKNDTTIQEARWRQWATRIVDKSIQKAFAYPYKKIAISLARGQFIQRLVQCRKNNTKLAPHAHLYISVPRGSTVALHAMNKEMERALLVPLAKDSLAIHL